MPILNPHALEFFSRSPEQTRRMGIRLGTLLQLGDLVCLSGDLGAGKTTLVQGVAKGWGSLDSVSSPTFVLVNQYRRPDGAAIHHLDAYRLSGAEEAVDLDLQQMFERGPLVLEWPERIRGALPKDCLWVDLRYMGDEHRGLTFTAHGSRYQRIVEALRKSAFGGL